MRTKLASWLRAVTPTSDGMLVGQGMVEYALILVLTTIVCIASVALVGDQVFALWQDIETFIGGALASR